MKHLTTILMLLAAVGQLWAQGPNGSGTYYRNANGAQGAALKTALCNIIRTGTVTRSYSNLWQDFKKTDLRQDGKIWDMYSGVTSFTPGTDQDGGQHPYEGYSYNREHSFPKSWFGGNIEPMYTDLFHLYPTDSYVNEQRGNYPFGENNGERYTSSGGFSKLGRSTTSGYSGIVFEPADEYKGDFARTYLYMVTRYEPEVSTWDSQMLAGNKYPALASWALKMLLRWSANDPVSPKEINRNKAVYGIQRNRNPFIDYPGIEQLIWGDKQTLPFSYDHYEESLGIQYVAMPSQSSTPATYDLQGRRLSTTATLQQGLYVRDGRKIIVR